MTENQLFTGAATYYSRYRPLYPSSLVRFLIERFSLDGKSHLLDVGCGTGQLTLRFADWFEGIVGIDTEPEMIAEAERLTQELRFQHFQWSTGTLASYQSARDEPFFKLVIIAKAFHWFDRGQTLAQLFPIVESGGGVAIIDNYHPSKQKQAWEEVVDEVVRFWYGKERRAGDSIYTPPTVSYEETIKQSPFTLETHELPSYQHSWDIASIIGNIYSSSYGRRAYLGDKATSFENHLTRELSTLNPSGIFAEEINLSVKLALKE